ncbi:MAG: hypothetical protein V1892_03670 [bacterium]
MRDLKLSQLGIDGLINFIQQNPRPGEIEGVKTGSKIRHWMIVEILCRLKDLTKENKELKKRIKILEESVKVCKKISEKISKFDRKQGR